MVTCSMCAGSSPRVRGKLSVPQLFEFLIGLIPARAGKTMLTLRSDLEYAAHPRACGENPLRGLGGDLGGGSSPRVRGKPGRWNHADTPVRLIPARAGKTPPDSGIRRGDRAHPRACGENRCTTARS